MISDIKAVNGLARRREAESVVVMAATIEDYTQGEELVLASVGLTHATNPPRGKQERVTPASFP